MIRFALKNMAIKKVQIILVVISIILSAGIAVIAFNVFMLVGFMPVGIVMPFVISFSVCAYIGTYAAYPMIKQVMIDPYYDENGEEIEE